MALNKQNSWPKGVIKLENLELEGISEVICPNLPKLVFGEYWGLEKLSGKYKDSK